MRTHRPLSFALSRILTIFMVAAATVAATAAPANATGSSHHSGKGHNTITTVTVECGPRNLAVETTSANPNRNPKPIRKIVVQDDSGRTRIKTPFRGTELTSYDLDPAGFSNITSVRVKAGNSGNPWHPIDIDATCDPDSDGIDTANGDNCPTQPNPDQANFDGDAQGDICDADDDNDGYDDTADCEPLDPTANPGADEIPNNNIDDNCNGEVDETPYEMVTVNQSVTVGDACGNCAEIVELAGDSIIYLAIYDISNAGGYDWQATAAIHGPTSTCRHPVIQIRARAELNGLTVRIDFDGSELFPSGPVQAPWDQLNGDLPTLTLESLTFDADTCIPG